MAYQFVPAIEHHPDDRALASVVQHVISQTFAGYHLPIVGSSIGKEYAPSGRITGYVVALKAPEYDVVFWIANEPTPFHDPKCDTYPANVSNLKYNLDDEAFHLTSAIMFQAIDILQTLGYGVEFLKLEDSKMPIMLFRHQDGVMYAALLRDDTNFIQSLIPATH